MLLKERLQATLIARTTKNLIKDRVGNLNLMWISDTAIVKSIKQSDSKDLIFLIILPIPIWPFYFIYREKVIFLVKKIKARRKMTNIEDTRKKIISDYLWIKRVIETSETTGHLKACRTLTESWSEITASSIRDYRCPFFRTSGVRKTIETYVRAKKELNVLIAHKSVLLGNNHI